MKKKQFILVDTGSESNQIMMSDVGNLENGTQISKTYETGNKILDIFIKCHFSYAVTQKIDIPFKSIWNKYCVLDKLIKDDTYEYYIIIVNDAIHRISVRHLNELQKKENIHIFSLILDPFDQMPKNIRKQIQWVKWEKIFSFQKSDCLKYGFIFTDKIYSKVDIKKYFENEYIESDVYFIGAAKDRINQINAIYKALKIAGFRCDFTVVVNRKKLLEYQVKYPGIYFKTDRISYKEILKKISKTNCILEICNVGQDGLTMRFYEAIFYNKMLITNNSTAAQSDLYNPEYMQIISEASDIDTAKLLLQSDIDYKYNNEYSPVHFLEMLVDG